MKTTIIGSSNIYRPYDILAKEDQDKIDLKRCTRITAFKVFINGLTERQRNVVISVIENFICDAVGSDPENENVLNDSIERIIKEFVEVINDSADKLPDTKFVMA